jgi:hypothetical protein
MYRFTSIVLAALAAAPGIAAPATPPLAQQSVVSIFTSNFAVNNGYSNRFAVGGFADIYSGRVGMHADITTVQREEDGTYGALGLSYQLSDAVRPQFAIGTSTKNDSILPQLFLNASVKITPGTGWVVTPGLTYRDYGPGRLIGTRRDYYQASVAVSRYFNMPSDTGGYWVAQADGALASRTVGTSPWSLALGLQTVRNNGWRFGVSGGSGFMAWDPQTGASDVVSHMWNIGGSIGYRFHGPTEVFARVSHAHNDFYDADGGLIGLRFYL